MAANGVIMMRFPDNLNIRLVHEPFRNILSCIYSMFDIRYASELGCLAGPVVPSMTHTKAIARQRKIIARALYLWRHQEGTS